MKSHWATITVSERRTDHILMNYEKVTPGVEAPFMAEMIEELCPFVQEAKREETAYLSAEDLLTPFAKFG